MINKANVLAYVLCDIESDRPGSTDIRKKRVTEAEGQRKNKPERKQTSIDA